MKTFTALIAASALAVTGASATGIVAPSPAKADPPSWAPAHGKRAKERSRIYDSRGRYVEPRRISRNDRVWRGDGGQYYCRRDNGTTGLVIGAGVGALAGSEIAGRGDRTLGAIIGGVAGGLLGREIDRGSLQCR
ncbi:glycine zipper 2TM domain-containing protein [Altererythrobacter sp. MTPC7]|uniref:glycine zipper 2TM domain-containing protein n=1 Tax=Altererythrobacter sp. MTPC7 TaxID=3056567 RepID=UPI0036F3F16C|nr:glycine zipper 2TM domain-containing protein [Erythrobacteraceae bacterium WH01K]